MGTINIIKNSNPSYPMVKNINGYEVEFLDPKILVFKNAFSKNKELIDINEKIGEWTSWYTFGQYAKYSLERHDFKEKFPTKELWESTWKEKVSDDMPEEYKNIILSLYSSLYDVSDIYMKESNPNTASYCFYQSAVAKYFADKVINSDDRSMNWHTDYQNELSDAQGYKFSTTIVYYPNDDYESGEISFKIYNESDEGFNNPHTFIEYKPSAGDIICFPSAHPYYHGVKRIYKNPKYIIRSYWQYYYDGSEYWKELKEKYGDRLSVLEKERLERNDFLITDPVQQNLLSMKAYYYLLENNLLPKDPIRGQDVYRYLNNEDIRKLE